MSDSRSIFSWTKSWANENDLKIWAAEETQSTNDIAKDESGFDLYLADQQTSGRGQKQNSWANASSGSALLSTWAFDLPSPPHALAAAVWGHSLLSALCRAWPAVAFSLKAPNDIYIENKKVAGLLLESITQGNQHRLIVGLGLNVFSHPTDITIASHLSHFLPEPISLQAWSSFLSTWRQSSTATVERSHIPLNENFHIQLIDTLNNSSLRTKKFVSLSDEAVFTFDDGSQLSWDQVGDVYSLSSE